MSAQASIHPTAIVAPGAQIPASCNVGPWCTIGPNVILGENCELISHVVLDGHLTIGRNNRIFSFACLGIAPQDLKYAGEPTCLEIGDSNSIREYVTVSRGTKGGGGTTRIGNNCLIMAYTHIGHDSVIGDHCILANSATLAGHVIVEDYAVVGALCPVHQFCRIGRHAYRLLQASKLNTTDALAAIRATLADSASPADTEHVAYLADFIAGSYRGIIK